MNTELVESLVQVIQTLPPAERSSLQQRLSQLNSPDIAQDHPSPLPQISLIQNLITSGKITPPQYPNRNTLSETEFRSIVSQIQIIGVPLSATVIEDRGE
jgi:hypothetical protein